jgi:hypothetical protein
MAALAKEDVEWLRQHGWPVGGPDFGKSLLVALTEDNAMSGEGRALSMLAAAA